MLDTLREDTKAAHDQDQAELQEQVNWIQEALEKIEKLSLIAPGATEEIAHHDAKEAVRLSFCLPISAQCSTRGGAYSFSRYP